MLCKKLNLRGQKLVGARNNQIRRYGSSSKFEANILFRVKNEQTNK